MTGITVCKVLEMMYLRGVGLRYKGRQWALETRVFARVSHISPGHVVRKMWRLCTLTKVKVKYFTQHTVLTRLKLSELV